MLMENRSEGTPEDPRSWKSGRRLDSFLGLLLPGWPVTVFWSCYLLSQIVLELLALTNKPDTQERFVGQQFFWADEFSGLPLPLSIGISPFCFEIWFFKMQAADDWMRTGHPIRPWNCLDPGFSQTWILWKSMLSNTWRKFFLCPIASLASRHNTRHCLKHKILYQF